MRGSAWSYEILKNQMYIIHSKFKILYFECLQCYSTETLPSDFPKIQKKYPYIIFNNNSYCVKPPFYYLLMQI